MKFHAFQSCIVCVPHSVIYNIAQNIRIISGFINETDMISYMNFPAIVGCVLVIIRHHNIIAHIVFALFGHVQCSHQCLKVLSQ